MAARKFDNWEPITESDSTIQAALKDASIPSLMVALVHLTGDESIMRGDIRPRSRLLVDPQTGVTEEQQAVVRAQAFEILKAYRDGGCQLPPAPNLDQISEMMNFIIGEPLSEAYAEFLVGELSFHGEDPFGQPGMEQIPQKRKTPSMFLSLALVCRESLQRIASKKQESPAPSSRRMRM